MNLPFRKQKLSCKEALSPHLSKQLWDSRNNSQEFFPVVLFESICFQILTFSIFSRTSRPQMTTHFQLMLLSLACYMSLGKFSSMLCIGLKINCTLCDIIWGGTRGNECKGYSAEVRSDSQTSLSDLFGRSALIIAKSRGAHTPDSRSHFD